MDFDLNQTNVAKGIAVLLLLWRHLFLPGTDVNSVFNIHGMPLEIYLDSFSFVCVSLFLFLSGYGLQKSFDSYVIKHPDSKQITQLLLFAKKHIIKLCLSFFFVYIICCVVNVALYGNIINKYYNGNVIYCIIDSVGLANIFSTPTMYGTWWFNGLIILLYALFPLLWKCNKYCGELLIVLSLVLLALPGSWDFDDLRGWILPFVLGMYIAGKNGFQFVSGLLNTRTKQVLVCALAFVAMLLIRTFLLDGSERLDAFLAFAILLISYYFISKTPILSSCLHELGKKSSIMYLIHPLVFRLFFMLTELKASVWVYIILSVLTYATAFVIVWIERIIGYNKLVSALAK